MKNLINLLIALATVSIAIGVISKLMVKPISGIASRGMLGFGGVLLLLAIALSVKK